MVPGTHPGLTALRSILGHSPCLFSSYTPLPPPYNSRLFPPLLPNRRRGVGPVGTSRHLPCLRQSLPLLRRLEDLKRTHECVVHAHHGPCVVELSAVVGGTEYGHQLPTREELVAVFDHLMRPTDQVQVVSAEELGHHVLAEGERHAAVVLAPPDDVLVGVGPQEVAEKAGVGDVCGGRGGVVVVMGEGGEGGDMGKRRCMQFDVWMVKRKMRWRSK